MWNFKNCAVVVAHPDDETLWAGGTMLMHPESQWTVVTLCRRSDPDRAPKFFLALERLNAAGVMGDLDDGPDQSPLAARNVQKTIIELLDSCCRTPNDSYDLVMTHGLRGEYTRHRRHEETGKAVRALWKAGRLKAGQIWQFAYEDGNGKYLPRAVQNADLKIPLADDIRRQKYQIITEIYGFGPDSFEAKTTPREEAFWCLRTKTV